MSKRHLDYFLKEILGLDQKDDNSLYSESQIIDLLQEKTGFKLQPETLRKEMKKLEERHGEAPLEHAYKVRKGWFERYPPKPPRHNHRNK